MKKTLLVISLLFLTFLFTPKEASAFSFKFPDFFSFKFPKPTIKPSATPKPSVSPSVSPVPDEVDVDAKYKMKTHTLALSFDDLERVKSVSIFLSYDSRGISQGVVDGFFPSGVKKFKKDIFLGSCSAGVCKPHPNAYNIKIQVTGFYNNNQPFTRNISIN